MMTDIVVSNGTQEIQAAITEAQRRILTQRTPPEVIQTRKGRGNMQFRYVTQAWVTEQLNLAYGWNWTWEIAEWRLFPNEQEPVEAMVLGRLTVPGPNGSVIVKQQYGSADVKRSNGKPISIGDDLKAASSDGLKKCASMLGLALDLYSEDVGRYEETFSCSRCDAPVKPEAARAVASGTGGEIFCKRHYEEWFSAQEKPAQGGPNCADCGLEIRTTANCFDAPDGKPYHKECAGRLGLLEA